MFGFGPSSKDRGAFQNPTWDEGFSFFGMKKGFKSFAHGLGMEGSKTCDEEFKRTYGRSRGPELCSKTWGEGFKVAGMKSSKTCG